jgi:hypothetical protein
VGSMAPLPAYGDCAARPPSKNAKNSLTWLIAGEVIVRAAYAELARSRAATKCVRIVGLISEIRVSCVCGARRTVNEDDLKCSS